MCLLLAVFGRRFIYLTTGLSIVLVWVGVKMVLLGFDVKIPTLLSLSVVIAVIAVSIVWSLRATTNSADGPSVDGPDEVAPPPAAQDDDDAPVSRGAGQ